MYSRSFFSSLMWGGGEGEQNRTIIQLKLTNNYLSKNLCTFFIVSLVPQDSHIFTVLHNKTF